MFISRKLLYNGVTDLGDSLTVMKKLALKWAKTCALALLALSVSVKVFYAAELIMFEQTGCPWCAKWEKEIGTIYPKTNEGKLAPLRHVDIHAPIPNDLKFLAIERFTPTFVLIENGAEIGRIRGYAGDEFFWYLLDDLVTQLQKTP